MNHPESLVSVKDNFPNSPSYRLSGAEAVRRFKSNAKMGLSPSEATARLNVHGRNQIETVRETPWWRLLLRQFWSPLAGLLIVAGGLSFWYGEFSEGSAILVVIFLNALIGFTMEWKARRTMQALRNLSGHRASVIRAGKVQEIDAANVVPGDLISLETGALIPADARLLKEVNLAVREAILTGESAPAAKKIAALTGDLTPADQKNTVFQGTIVVRGNGIAMVTATGNKTQLGQIANLTSAGDRSTSPLDKKLAQLGHRLIWLTLLIAGFIIGLGVYEGNDLYLVVKTAVALAVAAIPEGLPIVATLTLAIGMVRLAQQNMIAKTLDAVETLGQTQVLLIDKTGTLTENQLRVQQVVINNSGEPALTEFSPAQKVGNPGLEALISVAILCNNASLTEEDQGHGNKTKISGVGDPLELALLDWALRQGVNLPEHRAGHPRLREQPFSSTTGMMATLHAAGEERKTIALKGAPSVVLARCRGTLTTEGKISDLDAENWQARADALAADGYKVLAFAQGSSTAEDMDFAQSLEFLGLIAFWDPPRTNIRHTIDACQEAGISVVMATGDHPDTARSIGFQTGLIDDENAVVITGAELARTQVPRLDQSQAVGAAIYARVTPAQKLNLLKSFQEAGLVVGMAGDGVNDAPAIRRADVGIAMGEGGTEAAIEAADLILRDNSFATIVGAIRQGREIFTNIRLFVIYLLSCNLSEIFIVGASFVVDFAQPLLPLQILFLNMITDVFPALALGFTKTDTDVLKQRPRTKEEGILNARDWRSIAIYAVIIGLVVLGGGYLAHERWGYSVEVSNNLIFYTLLSAQLWHVFSMPPSDAHAFVNGITRNKYVYLAIALCVALTVGAYYLPASREVLGLELITDWKVVVGPAILGVLPVILIWPLKRLGWVDHKLIHNTIHKTEKIETHYP